MLPTNGFPMKPPKTGQVEQGSRKQPSITHNIPLLPSQRGRLTPSPPSSRMTRASEVGSKARSSWRRSSRSGSRPVSGTSPLRTFRGGPKKLHPAAFRSVRGRPLTCRFKPRWAWGQCSLNLTCCCCFFQVGQWADGLGVVSLSTLFSRRSFQQPTAISAGSRKQDLWKEWGSSPGNGLTWIRLFAPLPKKVFCDTSDVWKDGTFPNGGKGCWQRFVCHTG